MQARSSALFKVQLNFAVVLLF